MDKENIKEAAINYDSRFVAYRAFIKGAEWRINSVWHDINEIPKDGRIIVLLGKYGTIIIYGPNMMYYKEAVIMDGGFLKWAYKEDLIPNTK